MSTVLKRVEVTGGFLHDLDIDLSPGLNVIVGPRGAGKTSVLELLRYVFGVPGITEEGERRAHRHALDVLEDGSVNVTVAQDGEEASASRDASADEGPPVQPLGLQPLIVSQREIEDIGLNARSRLHILDGLVGTAEEHVEPDLLQQVQLAAAEIDRLLEVVDRQRTRLLELSDIPGRLATAEQEAEARGAASSQIETAQAQLRALSERLGAVSKGAGDTQQKLDSIDAVREAIADASEYASKLAGFQAEDPISAHVRKGKRMLEDAFDEIEAARKLLEQRDGEEGEKVTEIRRELREQGERLESLQSGAGDLAKRLTRLREQEVEHRQVSERIEGLEREIGEAQVNRDRLLDELDAFRQRRYERRKKGVELVARLFDGEIKVRLTKWGMFRDYEVALAKALTGSGLQYKALAHQIACRLDPRKLVEAVEDNDAWKVSELGEITLERAERLVSHLRSRGSASLLVAPLEDAVDYALLDGEEYKSTSELSTGQRCTVILPLLLAQSAQLTILDQPEDHLDNAFVVDTLVRALLARKNTGQLIIATHNANIPVLGNADKVIVMGSDGRHGGVQQIGGLDDPAVVRSVSSIMEGGEEAFRLRAEFYAGHGNEVKVAPERWSPPATERPDAGDPEPPAEERPPAEEAPDERAEAPAANSIAPEEDAAMAPEPAEPAPSLDDSVPEQDAAPASDPEPIEQDAPPVAEDAPLARESAPMADVEPPAEGEGEPAEGEPEVDDEAAAGEDETLADEQGPADEPAGPVEEGPGMHEEEPPAAQPVEEAPAEPPAEVAPAEWPAEEGPGEEPPVPVEAPEEEVEAVPSETEEPAPVVEEPPAPPESEPAPSRPVEQELPLGGEEPAAAEEEEPAEEVEVAAEEVGVGDIDEAGLAEEPAQPMPQLG